MASIYSWESFIRIHGGEPGARDVFETAMYDLLRAENPDREVHTVKASQGDGGIDVFVYQEDGIDIYQCKFFMGTLDSSRWSQIKKSFKKAMESKGVQVLRWYICMPREMQKEDIVKWDTFKKEKERKFPDVKLRYIDGNEIISRIEECDRIRNTALLEKYFNENRKRRFTNKGLIIPFTLSKANGAQGGTYVPRNDLLRKIELSFKRERIVFLSGIGGCGKSELARAYGYKHRDDYEEIFWLTCDDDIAPDFMCLMENADLCCKVEKSDTKDFSDKVLIIVDNCNSETPSFLGELENWTGKAMILVTTRLSHIGNYESIIPVESNDPNSFTYQVFEKNYCKTPRWGRAKSIQNEEADSIDAICRIVQYNTMVVSLIAIRLREYSNLSISECAKKMQHGIGKISGKIKYAKDQQTRSEGLEDILRVLFSDILNYPFSNEQKAVLTVLSLTSATWYSIDFICYLLGDMSNNYAVGQLLDFGWLQGGGDRMTIHPLIAEVISDQPILIQESEFFERVLENYLCLPDEYLGKERFLINKVLNIACDASPDTRVAVMLVINHGGYRKLFKENHPDVTAAYFVYVNHNKKRFYEYRDLGKNETSLLVEVPCQNYKDEQVVLLKVYNTDVLYKLDFNVVFHGMWIREIPEGFSFLDLSLSECDFGNHITRIGENAFFNCSGLSGELHLPESLTNIGRAAFYGCSGLSGGLHLPNSLTSIDTWVFQGCSGLSGELHLPESLTNIEDWAFYGCSGLRGELHLPESLASIGYAAFSGCSCLCGNLNLPESLTSIGEGAFSGCSGLHLPESIRSINESIIPEQKSQKGKVFKDIISVNGIIYISESLTSIEDYAFLGCSDLIGELHLPKSLTSIGKFAFEGCSRLSGELDLPGSLTSIGGSAFEGCSGLSGELHLPERLTSIGSSAFFGCNKIEKIYFHNINTEIKGFLSSYSDAVIVGYRHSTAEAYAREHGLVFEELEEE